MLAWLSKGFLAAQGRASILLLEDCWFNSPGLHLEISLGKILNPKLLPMCWLAPCMAATAISRFRQKRLLNVLNATVRLTLAKISWLTLAMLTNATNTQQLDRACLDIYSYLQLRMLFHDFTTS